jgi:L-fuconolactonase
MAAVTIDAHHHLWQYNDRDYVWMSGAMGCLRCDFLLSDLEQTLAHSGIDGAVTVQARQSLEETQWLLGLAKTSPIMRGVVGWVPLTDPAVERNLEKFAADPKLRAVRHVLHDEPDDDYMLREDFNRGIRLLRRYGLVYDILIFEHHLPQTLRFVDAHPNQTFVVDHIAKPRIRDREMSPWRVGIRELARRERVYCKLSGMVTEADWSAWTPADLEPYFDVVLSAFGPRRLMFGSDWPVLNLAADYAKWVETARRFLSTLSAAEQARIWGETALEAYGIAESGENFAENGLAKRSGL